MKNFRRCSLVRFLFCTIFLYNLFLPVMAENYTYKVYDPISNKSYSAVLGTMSISLSQYLWGFFTKDGKPLCVAKVYNTNNQNGLIGGQCTEVNAFINYLNGENVNLDRYTFGWRELTENSFYKEMNLTKKERMSQGKYEFNE